MDAFLQADETITIIVSTSDRYSLTYICSLLGSYMIRSPGKQLESLSHVFTAVSDQFLPFNDESRGQVTALDCWNALDRAMQLGSLVNIHCENEPALEVDEHEHCVGLANGKVHIVLPGTLLLLPTQFPVMWIGPCVQGRTARPSADSALR